MRVLGIDPGYDRLGLAVIEGNPSNPTLCWSACFTPPKGTHAERVAAVHHATEEAIRTYAPDALGIETLFFSRNRTTGIGVAEARGAALSAAGRAALPIIECSPQQVKCAVTGYGNADKRAVGLMVQKLVLLPFGKHLDDELDAIAIGITALAFGRPAP